MMRGMFGSDGLAYRFVLHPFRALDDLEGEIIGLHPMILDDALSGHGVENLIAQQVVAQFKLVGFVTLFPLFPNDFKLHLNSNSVLIHQH